MIGKDIVVISMQPWDHDIGSNAKNIAEEFSKHNRVLYVNEPLDRVTLFRSKKDNVWIRKRIDVIKGRTNGLVKIKDNLWNLYPNYLSESINWIPEKLTYNFLNAYNSRKFATCIEASCNELGFKDFILVNDNLMFKGLLLNELLKPEISAYYLRDFLIVQPYFRKHGRRIEADIMRRYDLILTNSLYLNEYAKGFNQKAFYVGQGCDLKMYDSEGSYNLPDELIDIKPPIIGYTGFLTTMRLDISLIRRVAIDHPEWSIVLVGPEDDEFRGSDLHSLDNVFFLGTMDQSRLPSFVKYFDVCINPQIVNELTIGNYPRKIDEYLAMGKPVVATETKTMEAFTDYVYLASTHEDFQFGIGEALENNTAELERKRALFAQTHSWKNSVDTIYEVFASHLKNIDNTVIKN